MKKSQTIKSLEKFNQLLMLQNTKFITTLHSKDILIAELTQEKELYCQEMARMKSQLEEMEH